MRINHNIPALNAHRMFNKNDTVSSKVLERLSSGKRINRAADDAAGMAISEKMKAQVNGLKVASRNALDGISLIQTAEGAMGEVHAMLHRMRELSVQVANEIYDPDDIEAVQNEIKELLDEVQKIAENTQFNEKKLLDGSESQIILQIGANEDEIMEFELIDISALGTASLDITGGNANAGAAITTIDEAIQVISNNRALLGAIQNRLEHTISNVDNTAENLQASLARIQDADMALEMAEFTKLNILVQAGTAMLAQANQRPQAVLQILNG